MKISSVNIYNDSINPTDGGIQNTAYCFVKHMKKMIPINALCCTLNEEYRDECVEIIEKYNRYNVLKWVLKHSSRSSCNIVLNCWIGFPALIAKIIKGSPYFVLAHGNDVYEIAKPAKSIKMLLFKWLNSCILRNADFVCCNSKYTLGLTQRITPKQNTFIIHPPCEEYQNNLKENIESHCIFSLGRLVERKGFQYVIEAVAILVQDYPELQYYIAGTGSYEQELSELIKKHNIEGNVHILGQIDDKEKIFYLSKCSLFIMPSIELENEGSVEGFGIVFVEASQFGKYVIGSVSGGIPDAITDDIIGRMIESVNAENVANEIDYVLQNFAEFYTEEKIRKRKKWAIEHYPDRIIKKYFTLLESEL